MLHELHPTYCLIFVSIVHTCLTIFQTRHNRVTVVFHYFMQVCFMAWKLSEANVSCGFLPLTIWKANPAMSWKKIIPSEIFISDAPEEQSFIHQYMWRTDNKLVELVFFLFEIRYYSLQWFSGYFLILLQYIVRVARNRIKEPPSPQKKNRLFRL